MPANLTLAQTISIATKNAIPPLHASALRKAGDTGSLSMLIIRDQVQARHTILVVQVRDASILKDCSSFAQLQMNWQSLNAAWVPSQIAMTNLINWLNASGVTVMALSKDWRTMWLAGPVRAFCAVQGALVGDAIDKASPTTQEGIVDHVLSPDPGEVLGGLALLGATCLAIGALTVGAPIAAVFVTGVVISAFVSGVLIGDGTIGLVTSQPSTVTTVPNPAQSFDTTGTMPDGGVQDATVYGADSTAAAQQITTAASTASPVTQSSLPPQPVAPPICPVTPVCPVITPVCPVTQTPLGPVSPTCPVGPTDPTGLVCPSGPPVCPGGLGSGI